MQSFKNSFLVLCLLALCFCFSCQSKKAPPQLVGLDLLRGDIILCGGDKFGEVSFSLACNPETRATFDLGVSLLHSFEYEEAEKAFVKVIDTDPDCAMAYWGVAMSITHSLWYQTDLGYLEQGSKLLEIANTLPTGEREKDYLDAINVYYKDWETLDKQTRSLLYEKKMEYMFNKYPEDKEAAIFYALALRASATPSDKSFSNQIRSGEILEEIFVDQPNHPGIAHYIIHNYDYPELAHLALPTARRYASIAPASSHAQHMPSHIFTQLGLWEESIESNVNSASSARCYAESSSMEGHWFNELHAMGYLVYAYLQKGDNKHAMEQYEYMKTMHNVYPANVTAIAYPFAAIPTRIAVENRQWGKAANLEPHDSELDWQKFPWQNSLFRYARALGSLHLDDISSAEKELVILKELDQEIENEGNVYKIQQSKIQIMQIEALMFFLDGKQEEALALAKEAVEMEELVGVHGVTPGKIMPAREFLADMLLDMNKPAQALEAYQLNLKRNPYRFNGIYGAAVSAKKLGEQEQATTYFEELLKLAEGVDSDRAELEEAREFVRKKES